MNGVDSAVFVFFCIFVFSGVIVGCGVGFLLCMLSDGE